MQVPQSQRAGVRASRQGRPPCVWAQVARRLRRGQACAAVRLAQEEADELRTHAMVLAQAWRDGSKQATLARLLAAVYVHPLDESTGRRAGELLAKAKMTDPIDAAVVLFARDGEIVLTGDVDDIERLARAAKRRLVIDAC